MKILVTGGAGFIGSNFIYYLLRQGDDQMVCLDALTYAGNMATLHKAMEDSRFRFIKGDIRDKETVNRILAEEEPDAVVNFAAESHVDRSIQNPEIFLKTNILGTQVLLDGCKKYKIGRFHQVSTDEVYGSLPLNRPDLLFTEETPLHASSPYAASKAAADLLVLSYYKTYGLPVTISRCSNNYGPYHFPEKLIPLIIINALEDKPLHIYGRGEHVRDWLYVGDHCSAIYGILKHGCAGEVYNVGGHNERTNLDVAETILEKLGKPKSLICFVEDRPGHDMRYAMDTCKIHRETGWAPAIPFDDGITRTVQWYLENRKWWQPVAKGKGCCLKHR